MNIFILVRSDIGGNDEHLGVFSSLAKARAGPMPGLLAGDDLTAEEWTIDGSFVESHDVPRS